MKNNIFQPNNGQDDRTLAYRVNGALAILLCLVFLLGSLFEMTETSTKGIFSEGNVLLFISILFVAGIFMSWYNEKTAGIMMLVLGLISLIYFTINSGILGGFLIPIIVLMLFIFSGIYFIADYSKNRV